MPVAIQPRDAMRPYSSASLKARTPPIAVFVESHCIEKTSAVTALYLMSESPCTTMAKLSTFSEPFWDLFFARTIQWFRPRAVLEMNAAVIMAK